MGCKQCSAREKQSVDENAVEKYVSNHLETDMNADTQNETESLSNKDEVVYRVRPIKREQLNVSSINSKHSQKSARRSNSNVEKMEPELCQSTRSNEHRDIEYKKTPITVGMFVTVNKDVRRNQNGTAFLQQTSETKAIYLPVKSVLNNSKSKQLTSPNKPILVKQGVQNKRLERIHKDDDLRISNVSSQTTESKDLTSNKSKNSNAMFSHAQKPNTQQTFDEKNELQTSARTIKNIDTMKSLLINNITSVQTHLQLLDDYKNRHNSESSIEAEGF